MNDENTMKSRLKRYVKVGSLAGGMAARYASKQFFGNVINNPKDAQQLRVALGGLKGPLMKVAQILSTIPDFLPENYMTELAQLQTNAPPMGEGFVRRRMKGELGSQWREKFDYFGEKAEAAASLGQVHKASDFAGRKLACKIQYPDMASVVEADLKQLKLAFSLYHRYDPTINPVNIHQELTDRLREELDYEREAKNMSMYRYMLSNEEGINTPEALTELSTNRLLTMSWLDGMPLLNFVDDQVERRNEIAYKMFRAWYVPLYKYGILHGDPHLGNYTFSPETGVNLLDFGCIRIFRPEFVRAVIDLYKAIRDNDEQLAVHAYETWGFADLNHNVIEILNQWAKFLYSPLLEDRVMPIQSEGGVAYGAGVAAKVHRELREVGGIAPPREFVLMDRSAIGLGSVFTRLKAEINWHQLFHNLIDDFSEDKLRESQTRILKEFNIEKMEEEKEGQVRE